MIVFCVLPIRKTRELLKKIKCSRFVVRYSLAGTLVVESIESLPHNNIRSESPSIKVENLIVYKILTIDNFTINHCIRSL